MTKSNFSEKQKAEIIELFENEEPQNIKSALKEVTNFCLDPQNHKLNNEFAFSEEDPFLRGINFANRIAEILENE